MSFANRFNKGNRFDVDTNGFDFLKLSELERGKVYKLKGVYINNKGSYGPSPVAIIEGHFVNLPNYTLSVVQDMLTDDEAIDWIKSGKTGFKVRPYQDKNGTERLGVEWVDVYD